MPGNLHIREATNADLTALTTLAVVTYIHTYGDSMDAADLAAHVETRLSEAGHYGHYVGGRLSICWYNEENYSIRQEKIICSI